MKLKTTLFSLCMLSLTTGCAELDALRQRTDQQEQTITQLRKENGEFQTAYYKIKEQMDHSAAESTTQKGQLELELDKAKNLRSQQEKDLADQLRSTQLEYGAYKNESENKKQAADHHIADLDANVRAMTAERDAALNKLKESDNALRAEQQRDDDLLKQTAALKVDNKTKDDRLAELQKSTDAAQAAQKSAQDKADDAAKQIAKLQDNLKKAQSQADDSKQKLADARKDLDAARDAAGKAASSEAERQKLAGELESARKSAAASDLSTDPELKTAADNLHAQVHGDKVQVKQSSRGVRLIIPSDLAFDPNSVVLSDKGRAVLTDAAKVLSGLAERNIKIEGHTDNQPVKDLPFADNWGLGSARADRVRDFLMQQGVSGDHVEAVSRADKSPLADNKTAQGRAENRRIEIVIGAPAK